MGTTVAAVSSRNASTPVPVHARRHLRGQDLGSVEGSVQGGTGEGEVPGERLGHVTAGGGGDQRTGEVVGEVGLVPVPRVVGDGRAAPARTRSSRAA